MIRYRVMNAVSDLTAVAVCVTADGVAVPYARKAKWYVKNKLRERKRKKEEYV